MHGFLKATGSSTYPRYRNKISMCQGTPSYIPCSRYLAVFQARYISWFDGHTYILRVPFKGRFGVSIATSKRICSTTVVVLVKPLQCLKVLGQIIEPSQRLHQSHCIRTCINRGQLYDGRLYYILHERAKCGISEPMCVLCQVKHFFHKIRFFYIPSWHDRARTQASSWSTWPKFCWRLRWEKSSSYQEIMYYCLKIEWHFFAQVLWCANWARRNLRPGLYPRIRLYMNVSCRNIWEKSYGVAGSELTVCTVHWLPSSHVH